jgi:ATP-dependent Lon protease
MGNMGNARQLPFIALRDIVLFPRAEAPIYIGREASVRAVKHAKAYHDGDIAVFTQLKAENNGPIAAGDIYQVGTLAKIVASVEMTDQTIKGMLEGLERIRLRDLAVIDGVAMATVTSEPENDQDLKIGDAEYATILALLSTWWPDLQRDSDRTELQTLATKRDIVSIVTALRSLASTLKIEKPGAERGWGTPPSRPSDHYRELMNQAVARRQKVLEETDFKQKLECLVDALRFDIACRVETDSPTS